MKRTKHRLRLAAAAMIMLSCTATAAAQEITVDPTTQFCFSADDFTTAPSDDGIFLTSVPSPRIATISYGNRILRAGDALPKEALNQLTLHTDCVTPQEVSVTYCTVSNGQMTDSKALKLSILPEKNEPPVAENSELETYKNIANSSTLKVTDPENSTLTYTITKEPKRGTVELHQDGTFTYTPNENKVGKDSFTFTATDDAGNTSEPATVSVVIKKPTDKSVYADMTNDEDTFAAMWLKETGLFTGSEIGGNLCFEPDKAVTRGEFLVMVMKLVEADASRTEMTSGFADEDATPVWMQPYITSALGNGMISGAASDEGVVFRPSAEMTKAEAAVMLQNILQLPISSSTPVFAREDNDATMPVWAAEAASALADAGINLEITNSTDPVTRRHAAKILYSIQQLMDREIISTFYWVQ